MSESSSVVMLSALLRIVHSVQISSKLWLRAIFSRQYGQCYKFLNTHVHSQVTLGLLGEWSLKNIKETCRAEPQRGYHHLLMLGKQWERMEAGVCLMREPFTLAWNVSAEQFQRVSEWDIGSTLEQFSLSSLPTSEIGTCFYWFFFSPRDVSENLRISA